MLVSLLLFKAEFLSLKEFEVTVEMLQTSTRIYQ